jgi:hypothetical protein
MKAVGHLVANDLRRFKWLLLAWVVLEVVATVVAGVHPTFASNRREFQLIGGVINLLWLVELVLFLVLTPFIVQADSLVSSNAFWMTRPIPPATLLIAKSLLIWIGLAIVPIAIESTVMMALHGMSVTRTAVVALQNVLPQTLILALLMTVAALTRSLAMFALVWAGGLVGLIAVIATDGLISTVSGRSLCCDFWRGTSDATAGVLLMVLWTLVCVSALIVQYRDRSWIRSAAVGVVGTVIAVVIASRWPWPLISAPLSLPDWALDSSALQLMGDGAAVKAVRNRYQQDTSLDDWIVSARLRVSTIPDQWSADVQLESAYLRLADGRSVSSQYGYYSAVAMAGEDRVSGYSAIGKLLGVRAVAHPKAADDGPTVLTLSDAWYRDTVRAPARYEARFRVALTKNDVQAALPLTPGARFHDGAYRLVIDAVRFDGRNPLVCVRESGAASIFDRQPGGARFYYLRNRLRSEAVPSSTAHTWEPSGPIPRTMPFVTYADSATGFSAVAKDIYFAHEPQAGVGSIDADWLAGAELVVVERRYGGSIERTLSIENFAIPAR